MLHYSIHSFYSSYYLDFTVCMCTSIFILFDGGDDNIDGYCMSMQPYYQASETTVSSKYYLAHFNRFIRKSTMYGWHGRAIYAILKQKQYNSATNMLKASLSIQPSSFRSFVIKTHILAQKLHRRQLNTKVCSSESAIFLVLYLLTKMFQEWLK